MNFKLKKLARFVSFALLTTVSYACYAEDIYLDNYNTTKGYNVNSGDHVIFSGDSNITSYDEGFAAIFLKKGGKLTLSGPNVRVAEGNRFGVLLAGGNEVNIINGKIDNSNDNSNIPSQYAFHMYGDNSSLNMSGEGALISGMTGIRINGNNNHINSYDGAVIKGVKNDAVESTGNDFAMSVSQGGVIGNRHGIWSTGANADIRLDKTIVQGINDTGIKVSGNNSTVIIDQSDISGRYAGINITGASSGSSVQIENSKVSGEHGIMVSSGNDLFVNNSTVVAKYGIWFSGGMNSLISNSNILASEYAMIFDAGDPSNVEFSSSYVTGHIHANTNAHATVNLTNGTSWTGGIAEPEMTVNLRNNSYWNNNKNSTLSELSLSSSKVNMTGGDISTSLLRGNDDSEGAESFVLSNYNHTSERANTLFADKSTGYFTVGVDSSQSGAAGLMYGNVILHSADATGSTFKSMLSDVGVFRYQSMVRNNEDGSTDVYLAMPGDNTLLPAPDQRPDNTLPGAPDQRPGNTLPGAPDQRPDNSHPQLSTGAQAVVNTRAAAVTLWRDEEEALNLRMDNNRRTAEKNAHGVWGSYYGSNARQQMAGASSGFEQTNNGFMLGYDKQFEGADGSWLFGGAVMRGSAGIKMQETAGTRSSITGYSGSLYSSYRNQNGFFVDGSLKAGRTDNDLSVTSLDNGRASAAYDTAGVGGSLKAGIRLQPRKELFAEPYASLNYARFNSVDYKLSNGLHAKDSGYESLRSEVGVNIGTQWSLNNAGEIAPYIHVAAADEMAKSNKMNMNGIAVNDSTDGLSGIVGLGADVTFKSGLGGYIAANYSKGENLEKPWQVNAGINYSW